MRHMRYHAGFAILMTSCIRLLQGCQGIQYLPQHLQAFLHEAGPSQGDIAAPIGFGLSNPISVGLDNKRASLQGKQQTLPAIKIQLAAEWLDTAPDGEQAALQAVCCCKMVTPCLPTHHLSISFPLPVPKNMSSKTISSTA